MPQFGYVLEPAVEVFDDLGAQRVEETVDFAPGTDIRVSLVPASGRHAILRSTLHPRRQIVVVLVLVLGH